MERISTKNITVENKNILLDANVLIFLFWPLGLKGKEDYYAKAYSILKRKGNRFFTHHIVLSETYNRILDNEYRNYCNRNTYMNKKEWRNSVLGKEAISNIKTILVEDILNNFEICNIEVDKSHIQKFIESEDLDFNDKILSEICFKNKYYLLSDDKDFRGENINIISANFSLCPQ